MINGQDLIRAYQAFYQTANPNEDFIHALTSYDFSDYHSTMSELSKLQPHPCGKVLKMQTSGSTTGLVREYKFGPISAIPQIESTLQNTKSSYSIMINAYNDQHIPDFVDNSHIVHDLTFNLKLQFQNTNLSALSDHLKTIHGNVCLYSKPLSLLYLSHSPEFLKIIDQFKDQITCINTSDWEPLFRKKALISKNIHLNDHMIDWMTGINFYSCSYGQYHFLPTFVYRDNTSRNLLNLTSISWRAADDLVKFGEVIPCACGKNRMAFSIIPHHIHQISNYFEVKTAIYDVMEELLDPYINLQFVEQENLINILYTRADKQDISNHDQNMLISTLNMPVVFQKDKFVMRGTGKVVPFTKSIDKLLNYTYKPKHVQFM